MAMVVKLIVKGWRRMQVRRVTYKLLIVEEIQGVQKEMLPLKLRILLERNRSMWGIPRQSWILDSTPWIPDFRYWFPVFVNGIWILNSNRQWDSGFLELSSGFQSPGFRISLHEAMKNVLLVSKKNQNPCKICIKNWSGKQLFLPLQVFPSPENPFLQVQI